MIRKLALLILLMLPATGQAGAWMREKGSVFLSWSNTISTLSSNRYASDTSLFIEYGLTPRLTVGFDGYLGALGKASEAYLFMRLPIGRKQRAANMALTFGIGHKTFPNPWGTVTKQSLTKFGFSWGRGLKHGWLAFDAAATTVQTSAPFVPGQSGTSYSADFTWGQKPSERLMLIWQLQTGKTTNGAVYAKFAPSVIWAFGEKRNNSIEIGLIKGLHGDESQSVKLGFWKSF